MRLAIVYGIVTWDKHKLTVPEVFANVNSAQFLLVSNMAILEVKSFRAPRHTENAGSNQILGKNYRPECD